MAVKLAGLCLAASVGTAHADTGFYLSEAFGGSLYRGGMRAYGQSAMRGQVGFEYRDGDRAYSLLGGAALNIEGDLYCVGDQCGLDPDHEGGFHFGGFDVKQRWHLWPSSYSRIGLRMALHGGPRYYDGDATLTGYAGFGVSGGATVELDLAFVGMYFDAGVDVMHMEMPADSVTGAAPYLSVGIKLGRL